MKFRKRTYRDRRRDGFRLEEGHHSKKGIISTVLGIVGIIAVILMTFISSSENNNSGIISGFLGLLMLGISAWGLYISVDSLKEKEVKYLFPIMGLFSNGALLIFLLALYIIGIFI